MLESFSEKGSEVGTKNSDVGKPRFDPDRRLDTQDRPKETSFAEQRIDPDRRIDVQDMPKENLSTESRFDPDRRIDARESKPELAGNAEIKEMRMAPPIEIKFRCPEWLDKTEFLRQLKGQEISLNKMSIKENMENRAAFRETGKTSEAIEAQKLAREKAKAERFSSNLDKGMSVEEARAEAKEWIKTQAALHNPDQIAGGRPDGISGMGDARVNSSIGAQWRNNVEQLEKGISECAKGMSKEMLSAIKLDVKLTLEV